MDLWIRSQDKMELILIKTKLKICEGDLVQISINPYIIERECNILHGMDFLGKYKTKERALEVLDEIQRHLSYLEQMVSSGRAMELDFESDFVYDMPEEYLCN